MTSGPLSTRAVDHDALWRALRALLDRVSTAFATGEARVDDCLDIVVELLGADRGMVLLVRPDGSAQAIHARGTRGVLNDHERDEISKTIVRRALDAGECVVWNLDTQRASSSSVGELGIFAALAAPLPQREGGDARGVLYVDVRDPRKSIVDRQIDFFMAAVVLFTAMLELQRRGEATRAQLAEARSHVTDVRHTPALADLVAPRSLSALRAELASAVTSDSPIFILGETGTGKTLLAQSIAEASGRRPIVRAVLGGSDDLNTITSELFGHERGSFSGATSRRVGLVEYAKGGTLVLDEVLNLPPEAQKLLLDFTQFGTYRPLGYDRAEPKKADVRIIAATNGDIQAAIAQGRFREDLYYRLSAVTLTLPPLRERREDMPALAESTLRRVDPSRAWSLSTDLRQALVSGAFDWPGNVRQFEMAIRRARERALSEGAAAKELRVEHVIELRAPRASASLGPSAPQAPREGAPPGDEWQKLQDARSDIERRERAVLEQTLAAHDGIVAHAARELGIARTTLASRLQSLGMVKR